MPNIELSFPSGMLTLTGTFAATADPTQPAAALLLSGSGPLDRNSNMKKLAIDVMGQVAVNLGHHGVASFRYDKRGVGASGGDYLSAGFHDNLADARSALDALRARPEIDADQVVVIGHSEGAMIAAELAAQDPTLAGVVLLAGTASNGEQLLRWQAETVSETLPRPVKLLLRVLRQDVLKTQQKRLDRIRATTTDTVRIQLVKLNAKWFREFMAHDPKPSLRAIRVPVLAITGAKDIQVDPADVARICELVPGECSGELIANLTHLLRTDDGPPSVRTYKKQAARRVAPEVLSTTVAWIEHHTSTTPTGSADAHL